jgi:hypothetical protein
MSGRGSRLLLVLFGYDVPEEGRQRKEIVKVSEVEPCYLHQTTRFDRAQRDGVSVLQQPVRHPVHFSLGIGFLLNF